MSASVYDSDSIFLLEIFLWENKIAFRMIYNLLVWDKARFYAGASKWTRKVHIINT